MEIKDVSKLIGNRVLFLRIELVEDDEISQRRPHKLQINDQQL